MPEPSAAPVRFSETGDSLTKAHAETERGAGSGASPECASNSVSRAGHSTPATPPTSSAAHTSLAEKQRTLLTAALLDLRDVVDSFIEGDASIKDVENALARTYEVPRV